MLTNNILTSDMIDIIFDGRNKEYGAYELRKSYSKRIGRAMLITGAIVGLTIGGVVLANSNKKSGTEYKMTPGVIISDVQQKQQEKMPEEKPKEIEKPKVKEIAYLEPKIVKIPNDPPPSTLELETGKIGDKDVAGVDSVDVVDPGPPNTGGGDVIEIKPPKEEIIFVPIEIAAKCNCNWPAFLERNLVAEVPINNGAPAGRYKVEIKFTIDEKGSIISTEALTNYGYGMEQEAIRVIKKANSMWEPPFQNGVKLKATMRQTIIFVVQDEEG